MSARSAAAAVTGPKKRLPRGRDRCAGCHSDRREQLDADIVAKVPYRVLAERYSISSTAIFRHRKHVSVSLVPITAAAISNGSDAGVDVMAEARRLYEDCRAALDGAVQAGNLLGLSLAAREVHRSLELLGRQLERIESRRGALIVDFATDAGWLRAQAAILAALDPYPDAALAVADALRELRDHDE
jgi:hypothetical protein